MDSGIKQLYYAMLRRGIPVRQRSFWVGLLWSGIRGSIRAVEMVVKYGVKDG